TLDPGTDFRALADGESATLDIPYTVTDVDHSTTAGHVVFTIEGVNQAPAIANGIAWGQLIEDVAPTNLLKNGDFETDGTAHWTGAPDGATGFGAFPHGGREAAGFLANQASLTQSIQTVDGQSYVLSFWAQSAGNASIVVDWNGAQVASFALPATPDLHNY